MSGPWPPARASASSLEIATIEVATSYAVANGYAPNDRRAVGLVLAGMAIAASCSSEVREGVLAGYLAAFPKVAPTIQRWARILGEEA